MQISKRAFDFIVEQEISDEKTYNARYRRGEWPGGGSGVTVGIGFDLGMATAAEVSAAWAGKVPAEMVKAMCTACGVVGSPAKALTEQLFAKIDIPYETAMLVFNTFDVPREEAKTRAALPNCDLLSADSFGALVSLTYNRGASYGTQRKDGDTRDRYREMRNIKTFMTAKHFDRIPQEFVNMKRLWEGVGLAGLLVRRDEEAQMFEDGIGKPAIGPPRLKPSPTMPEEPPRPPAAKKWWEIILDILFGSRK